MVRTLSRIVAVGIVVGGIWIGLIYGEGNGNPLQYSCLENPRDGGAWWAALYGVAQSQKQLKQLSSSSNLITLIWVFSCATLFHILYFLFYYPVGYGCVQRLGS